MFGSTVGVSLEYDVNKFWGASKQAKKKTATCTETPKTAPEPDSNFTVSQLIEHYLKHEFDDHCERAVKIAKAYRYILKNYIIPQWGTYTLGAVKIVAVESWLKSIDKANDTKAKIREVFGAAFRHAMRHELHPSNPISHVRQVRKRVTVPYILEPAEIVTDPPSSGGCRTCENRISPRRSYGHKGRKDLRSQMG